MSKIIENISENENNEIILSIEDEINKLKFENQELLKKIEEIKNNVYSFESFEKINKIQEQERNEIDFKYQLEKNIILS
jgi:hypothetical protein